MFMPKEKPPFVYKYCSAERALQIIQDLTFYFAISFPAELKPPAAASGSDGEAPQWEALPKPISRCILFQAILIDVVLNALAQHPAFADFV